MIGQSLKVSRRSVIVGTLAAGAASLAAACVPNRQAASPTAVAPTSASGAGSAPVRVTVGQIPILISAPLYIAQDKGYFREGNLAVELVDTLQASDTLAGLTSGTLDVGAGGVGAALMNGIQRGVGVKIVAPLHVERPPVTTPLTVAKRLYDAGEVRTVADLRGRKVAVNSKGSATEYWLELALNTGGLTMKDVEVVALSFPDAVTAMAGGTLDGAMVGEPAATQGVLQGAIVRLKEDFVDNYQVTAVYYADRFIAEQRPAGEAFLTAFLRGARDLLGPGYTAPENLAILEKYTKVPAALIKQGRLPYHDPNGTVKVQDFEKLQAFFLREKSLTYTEPMDIRALVDTSFAEAAVARLGRAPVS